jgi:predicted DNA-binding antitoxin AbrB/MazE fold protein
MVHHVHAIYDNGVLKPLEPLDLRDQEIVSLSIDKVEVTDDEALGEGQTFFDILNRAGLVGSVKGASPDLSSNPQHLEGFGGSGK